MICSVRLVVLFADLGCLISLVFCLVCLGLDCLCCIVILFLV